jgi:phage tail-like protein
MTDLLPPAAFAFRIALADDPTAGAIDFAEVSGLAADDVVPVEGEGGAHFAHRLPRAASHPVLVLKRGLLPASGGFAEWLQSSFEGPLTAPIQPHDIEICLRDAAGATLVRWTAQRAWPVNWRIGLLQADTGQIACESVEFGYATLARKV